MRHGLVQTVSEAYLEHRALVLRPDDIWLAILTQFSLYVNKHAEDLRENSYLVYEVGTRHTIDFGDMAHRMTSEMDKFIVDRALRDWILPKFSTTTDNDTVVASVTMMATMKAYFEYSFGITCGIPLVVLEGERADWEDVLRRARKLMEYGEETTAWYSLLRPVLDRFVRAFDAPDSKENLTFWDNVVFYQETGCGDPTEFMLTGWLSAFCVFSVQGGWIGNPVKGVLEDWYNSPAGSNELERSSNQSTLSATTTLQSGSIKTYDDEYGCRRLWLDGMPYHHLDGGSIPPSIVEVDVNVIEGEITFPSVMVAGIVGASVLDSGSANVSATGVGDTIAPAAGWWLYVKKGADQKELISLLEKRDAGRESRARLDAGYFGLVTVIATRSYEIYTGHSCE
ncbi:hypothetical protein PENSPDRAFT_744198 [Peniophora sp. CONT]|nr:hypothetical protein PENSPDRAFT_744198 [Peniophora sp. CONT]